MLNLKLLPFIDFAGLLRGVERNNEIYEPDPFRVRLLADQLFRQASLSKDEEESPRTRNLASQEGTLS